MSCCRRNRRCSRTNNWRNSCRSCGCNSMNDYSMSNRCSCRNEQYNSRYETGFPENYMLAHAYTPNQVMNKTFTPEMALQNGTLFPELVSPYYPGQSMEVIEFLRNDDRNGGCGCE